MTENPNTPPDPKAGPPPGGAVGEPAQPASAPAPEPASPAEHTEHTEHVEHAEHTEHTEHAGDVGAGNGATAAGEYPEAAGPVGPDAPNAGLAATFLPGIDAAAVLALVVAALAAGVFLLVNPLVQAHDAARTWSDFKNNVPRAKQDPFGVQRDWVSYQSWGFIILGLVAVLLALLVLGLWSARRNKLRSRAFAQAALVLGLAVVLYGILLKTGAVGSEIPSMKEISNGLSSATQ